MGGFSSIVRGALAGLNEAAGNDQTAQQLNQRNQQEREAQMAQLKAQIVPHALAIKGLQTKLSSLDPNDPHYHDEQALLTNEISRNLAEVRGIIYPDKDSKGNFFERGITDKLHMTSLKRRQDALKQKQEKGAAQDQAGAQALTTAAPSYTQTPQFAQSKALEEMRAKQQNELEAARAKSSLDVANVKADAKEDKPSKGLEAIDKGGVFLGIKDGDTGTQYLPSQLGPNGNAPPEAKQMWQTIQDAKKAKQAEEDRKEDERDARQARTLAASFDRMGRQQEFQELMRQYSSDLQTYRGLDTAARNSETTVNALEAQYSQPGNKAVADNELQNFYTTVVQKGGRKTAAELNLTLKIGSFGMNIQQMASKAATGELPDQLRKELLNGMKAVAKEQRETADQVKPELPSIGGRSSGPKTQQLKSTRGSQKWTAPKDAPPAPREDNKLLKADGKVIAKSKGGQWVQP